LQLTLFEQELVMPQRVTCWEKQNLTVAPYSNIPFVFQNWSDGGAQQHVITVPAKTGVVPKFVATFENSYPGN
jgi:hypothetical protein